MSRVSQIAQLLTENASVMTDALGHDCCTEASRVVTEVFRQFGIRSDALVVTMTAWNDRYRTEVDRFGRLPDSEEERQEFFAKGCWSVGCGFMIERLADGSHRDRSRKRWAGHLVAVAEEQYLVDLTASQVSRPEHGLCIGPVALPVDDGFMVGRDALLADVPQTDRGPALVIYNAYPEKLNYTETGGWNRTRELRPLTEEMMRRVRLGLRTGLR